MRIALGEDMVIPIETNIFEDVYAGGAYVPTTVAQTYTPAQPATGSIWDAITGLLSNKPLVNAAANKYLFGGTGVIPQSTNPYAAGYIAPYSQTILGIPQNTFLLGAAALAAVIFLAPKRGRR